MTHEELLGKVNEGRTAGIALDQLSPIFAQCEKELIDSLKMIFNTGTYTEVMLVSHVAQLAALEKLQQSLRSKTAQGETSFQQITRGEFDNGRSE